MVRAVSLRSSYKYFLTAIKHGTGNKNSVGVKCPFRIVSPYTFVLEPGLRIYKIYNGYWFWGRPSTAELWQDLREVTRKNRPDWELAAPGIKENWDGDKKLHYPYKSKS